MTILEATESEPMTVPNGHRPRAESRRHCKVCRKRSARLKEVAYKSIGFRGWVCRTCREVKRGESIRQKGRDKDARRAAARAEARRVREAEKAMPGAIKNDGLEIKNTNAKKCEYKYEIIDYAPCDLCSETRTKQRYDARCHDIERPVCQRCNLELEREEGRRRHDERKVREVLAAASEATETDEMRAARLAREGAEAEAMRKAREEADGRAAAIREGDLIARMLGPCRKTRRGRDRLTVVGLLGGEKGKKLTVGQRIAALSVLYGPAKDNSYPQLMKVERPGPQPTIREIVRRYDAAWRSVMELVGTGNGVQLEATR